MHMANSGKEIYISHERVDFQMEIFIKGRKILIWGAIRVQF